MASPCRYIAGATAGPQHEVDATISDCDITSAPSMQSLKFYTSLHATQTHMAMPPPACSNCRLEEKLTAMDGRLGMVLQCLSMLHQPTPCGDAAAIATTCTAGSDMLGRKLPAELACRDASNGACDTKVCAYGGIIATAARTVAHTNL